MAVKIESAYLGDERSRINVLDSIRKKMGSDGSLSVPVNSGLIPMLQIGGEIRLTKEELQDAKDKAVDACGGPNDPTCIEKKKADFQRQRLEEKELESQSNANIIKGRRLTVTVIENGRKKTFEVPEGQTFELGKPTSYGSVFDFNAVELKPKFSFSVTPLITSVLTYLGIAGATFLYAISILATYKVFNDAGYVIPKYIATASSVIIPYSGIPITLVFFALRTWIQKMPSTQ